MSTITDLSQDPAAALDAVGGAVERGASLLAGGSRAAGPATPQDDTNDLVPAADAVGVAVIYEGGFTAIVMVTPDLAEDLSGQRDASAMSASIGPVADEIASALGVAAVSTSVIESPAAIDQHLVGVELLVASGVFAGDAVVATVAVAMTASAGAAAGSGDSPSPDAASSNPTAPPAADPSPTSTAAPLPTTGAPGNAVPPRSATSAAAVADAPPAPVISDAALSRGLSILAEVSLEVTAELGRAALRVSELLDLQPGSIIELDREAGAPVELFVNGTLFARAEVVVVDGQYAVRICELFGGGAQR